MSTDFEKNALTTAGGILPGTTDTPGDIRTRVETEADILNIPNPYIGMVVYVLDTGKRFEVVSLKDKKAGFSVIKNALVDEYVEFDPAKDKGYAKEADVDAALEGKADKADLEGLASEEFVEGKVEEVVGNAPAEFDTLEEVAAEFVKVDQKIEDAKFDDSELKGRLDALEAIDHDAFLTEHQAIDHLAVKEEVDAALELKADKTEIPSLEGFATEEFVQEKIDAIVFPEYDDSEVISRLEGLEAIDHEEFIKEHQDISHLAVKADVDAALEVKADKADLVGLATEQFVNDKVAEVLDAAPEALDTLKELADALGGDENFAATVAEQLGQKANAAEVEERFAVLEAIDHEAFITEHQDISHLAVKADVESAMAAHEEAAQAKFAEVEAAVAQVKTDCEAAMVAHEEEANAKFEEVQAKAEEDHAAIEDKVQAEADRAQAAEIALEERIAALEAIKHVQPNFQYAVNIIGEAEEANFVVTGEFPDYVITLNLPQCFAYRDPSAGRMWYGWIPYDESGETGFATPDDINDRMTFEIIQHGIDNGSVVEMDPQPLDKTSIGSVHTEAGFVCVIVPRQSNYVAYLDNGMGGKISFDEINSEDGSSGFMYCQNGVRLDNEIDGVEYSLYGAYVFSPGERFIYVEEK